MANMTNEKIINLNPGVDGTYLVAHNNSIYYSIHNSNKIGKFNIASNSLETF